jgi:glycosyltransferase involved in cell wall biosynthesis
LKNQAERGVMPSTPSACILSSGRNPNDERMYYKIARSLLKKGAGIVIIAPGAWDHRFDDGIEFVPIPKRRSRWNRIGTWRALYREALKHPAGVYQCEEIDSWLIGWLAARKTGARLVYDAHEFDPAQVAGRAPRFVRGLLGLATGVMERFLARRTQAIFVANDIVRGYFLLLDRFAKIEVLENAPVLSLFKESGPPRPGPRLCHEGSLNFDRGLKMMLRLLARLRGDGIKADLRIVGDVFGAEREWLEREVPAAGLEGSVQRTGWLQYPEVGAALEGCSIGLITMHPIPSNMLSGRPNKLFNYMRYGIAVIAPDFPEIAKIVREEQCGLVYNPGDEESLFQAVMTLAKDEEMRMRMGANGRNAVLEKYHWEKMEERLFSLYPGIRA